VLVAAGCCGLSRNDAALRLKLQHPLFIKIKPLKNIELLRRVLRLATPYPTLLTMAVGLVFVITPVAILRPYLIQYTVDKAILQPNETLLARMMLGIFGVLLLEAFLTYSFTQITNRLGQNVIYDLRVRVFAHILRLRLRYFDTTPIGTAVTRTISDVETINAVFSEGIITITADLFTIVAVLAVMLYTSWQLTFVSLLTLPFLMWATWWFKEGVKGASQIVRTQVATMNAFLQERISGMRIVQLFNAEAKELTAFRQINAEYRRANIDTVFHYALFFPIVEILSAASIGLMVWYGASSVVAGYGSLGVLIAFPLYLNMLFRPVRMLADKFNTLQMGLIAAERVFVLLEDDRLTESDTGKTTLPNLKGDISFRNINFEYIAETPILKDVSFTVENGQTLAIVGATGSGKTTIINILNRFYPLKSGSIYINDTNIADMPLNNLRTGIGMVLQDVFLFAGTVFENITLRNANITMEQVTAAAQLIGAHSFIARLPQGYDYQVQERGAMLSAGQRQLISFVRALVYQPDILILDEATSNIDPETEATIQYAIEKLIEKRTAIIVAHRLTTIRHAHRILVLDKGVVREFGTHDELISITNGVYRRLYDTQLTEAQ
jgi:ATP-binding cassette, subfamily B, multidrug efflux pump